MASPIARKSTKTADSIVNTECQGLLLNLQEQMLVSQLIKPLGMPTSHAYSS